MKSSFQQGCAGDAVLKICWDLEAILGRPVAARPYLSDSKYGGGKEERSARSLQECPFKEKLVVVDGFFLGPSDRGRSSSFPSHLGVADGGGVVGVVDGKVGFEQFVRSWVPQMRFYFNRPPLPPTMLRQTFDNVIVSSNSHLVCNMAAGCGWESTGQYCSPYCILGIM